MKKPQTQSIPIPESLSGNRTPPDRTLLPVERLKLFSPDDWEEFVCEWTFGLDEYEQVYRAGGAGDKGCDVVATVDADPDGPWDNYQCKRLGRPLQPDDIWIEIGKVCYFSFVGEYTLPRRYYFVCSRGVGVSAARLLRKPALLKAQLLEKWAAKCSGHISKGKTIALDVKLAEHIRLVDFSMFRQLPVLQLIEGHAKTRYHAMRFGTPLPPRSPAPIPPAEVAPEETRYVQQLLEAYGDNRQATYNSPSELDGQLSGHFSRAREYFYCAEHLRAFSRDSLPEGAFEHLRKQIYDGVIDVSEADHPCGLTRLDATTSQASTIAPTSSALVGRTDVADKKGICHQLANEDCLIWVPR